jgi:septal ring factor EnvC (AmiA/AmiB activator)
MRSPIIVLAAGLILSLPPAAFSDSLKKHDRHEEKRINKGEKHGALTDKEADKLEDKQEAVQEERAEAKEDGKITKREKKSIRHEQKELSQDIYRKKHNDRRE